MLCTEIVSDIQNNFCTQHVLEKEELLTKIYLYRDDNFVIFNTCLEQVFECLKTILCWNGFGEQVELLKLALSHFANLSTKLDKDKYRSINISPPFFFCDTVEIQVTQFKSTNLGTPKPGSRSALPPHPLLRPHASPS